MKILIKVASLTLGGAERVAVELANSLYDKGHSIVVLTDMRRKISYRLNENISVIDFNHKSLAKCFNPILHYSKIIKQEKPDVILGFGSYQSFISKMAQLLSRIKIPVVYTEHNVLDRPEGSKLSFMGRFYKFYFSRICDVMTVLTQVDKDYASDRLNNLYVMPNPMSLKPCDSIGSKEKVVLSVGRLNAWHYKGFDLLLEAWGRVSKKHPDWKLQVVGAGNEDNRKKILSFAQKAGCAEHFELLPYTEDIMSVYKKASVYVLSSRYEGFGLVVTEAMSQGCACLAADYKGRQSEIITDGLNGLLCPPDSVDELERGLLKLIEDDSFRSRVQEKAIERSKDFSPNIIVERWDSLLARLVK